MHRHFLSFAFLITAIVVATTKPALAYVDPGTTTSVFGIVAAALSGLGAALAFLIRPIKNLLRKKKDAAAPAPAQKPPDNPTPGSA